MGTELTGSPGRRQPQLGDLDPALVDFAQQHADLKLKVEALTLDLEHANREIHTLTGAIGYRDERIKKLEAQNSNLLMRCAEVATHIVQVKKIADTAVGSLDRTLVDVRNGNHVQLTSDADDEPRPN